MSANETIYSFRVTTPDHIERARTQVLKMPAYREGALAAPASGTFTLKDPNGTAVVDAAAVTVTSSIAQRSLASGIIPVTTALGDGWLEEWALVMPDGTTRTVRRTAAIALRELFPAVSLIDLRGLHSNIDEVLGDIDPTGQFKLELAWTSLYRKIQARGNKPYKILNPEALFEPLLFKWAEYCFRDAKTNVGDGTYKELAADYRQDFKDAWEETQLVYDDEEDGIPEADQPTKNVNPPVFLSSPKSGWRGLA